MKTIAYFCVDVYLLEYLCIASSCSSSLRISPFHFQLPIHIRCLSIVVVCDVLLLITDSLTVMRLSLSLCHYFCFCIRQLVSPASFPSLLSFCSYFLPLSASRSLHCCFPSASACWRRFWCEECEQCFDRLQPCGSRRHKQSRGVAHRPKGQGYLHMQSNDLMQFFSLSIVYKSLQKTRRLSISLLTTIIFYAFMFWTRSDKW